MTYALDSWAILSWLDGEEPAATRVEDVMKTRPLMSWLNLGEVFYIVMRRADEKEAERVLRAIRHRITVDQVSPERVLAAARIKAQHPMAFADAFAIATALANRAVLLTGDPEILSVDGPWTAEDLRPATSPSPAGGRVDSRKDDPA